ncbi:aminopeptidase [Enhygromyxa salina]|uniref:Aminopeptidase n=1 Tax=Enhygromyxa salina TaxID=215803 RepID=A0A0C2DCF6_9BACT|nr:M20/M25/M40 family metallo-hydrolase [Enhygromyxa salina]KIG19120.1 aminopeptidase [Enhygromyxa salina]
MRGRLIPLLALSSLLASFTGCAEPTPAPVDPGQVAIDLPSAKPTAPSLSADSILASVGFLADDAQQGRAPGTEADARVQAWIIERMQAAGLEPGGDDGFVQRFEVGDGARLREGQTSRFVATRGRVPGITHEIVPFGHDTGESGAIGRLVFVGHGLPGEGDDPGDFAGLELEGAIAVALLGAADPHAAPAKTRPQSKLIAARDRGAVGLVLWDPDTDTPWANHGQFSELEIPAVFVGKAGTEALRVALRLGKDAAPKLGASSRAPLELHTPIEPVVLTTANLLGVLPGSDPAETRKRVIIGAHMDHLGLGTSSSLAPGEHAIHNGADDNASGVAVVLELAAGLAKLSPEQRPHDLVFVTFGAEEMGLLGSKHMVEALPKSERARVLAMLNFDMVGRLRDQDALALNGTGSAKEWPALVEIANPTGDAQLKLAGTSDGWGPSDHASFYGEGVPVLHFFTGAHDDYHKPSDDLDKFDSEGAAAVGELAGRIVLALLDRSEPLTYVKVERASMGRTVFRVSLGTMPDYGREVDGMALSGVSEGGPAAAAGLQKGDVITRIGDRAVHNIDDYMACFGELEPGVAVEIEWTRDGATQTGELTPAAPRTK